MIGLSGARRRSHQYVNEQPFSERKLVAYEEAKRLFQQHQHERRTQHHQALEACVSLRRGTTSGTGTQHLLNYDQHDEYEQTKLLEVRRKDKILSQYTGAGYGAKRGFINLVFDDNAPPPS